jgi:Ca2+/Na+ antiporter
MQTTLLIIIIAFLVLCVLYLYGLNYLNKEIHKDELELKDLQIKNLEEHKKFHEDLFFKMEEEKHKC